MIKYILIIAVGFGAYNYFTSPSGFDFSSNKYSFEITFPSQPKKKVRSIKVPNVGNFKSVIYAVDDDSSLKCMVTITGFSKINKKIPMGSLDNEITKIERNLLKDYGGKIEHRSTIFNSDVAGRQINSVTRDKKLIETRLFEYKKKLYNIICFYENSDKYSAKVNDFMQSFRFIK